MMISTDSGKESFVVCRNSQGSVVRATVLRMTRHTITFEVYNPYSILQNSEVLSDFKIFIGERLVYNGKAVVSGIVNTGLLLICEVSLGDSWIDVDIFSPLGLQRSLKTEFEDFLKSWEKINIVITDFKVMVSDTQMFLTDLKRWLEQVEFSIQTNPHQNQHDLERNIFEDLQEKLLSSAQSLFDRLQEINFQIEEPLKPLHRFYAKQQLHPLLLCSPFVHRAYQKPLGYAGDYEVVNMMLGEPIQGGSLFAKAVNFTCLQQAPVIGHRNRIKYLTEMLAQEVLRIKNLNRRAKIFNLGCGPAQEVQNFIKNNELSNFADFTLVDFNDETLKFSEDRLRQISAETKRDTQLQFAKKSVHEILKEYQKLDNVTEGYDLVYCAGLFDYLSDRICKRLMNIFYKLLKPGGLLIATNVAASNPGRGFMEYIMEWFLVYRDKQQFLQLAPEKASASYCSVKADPLEVNIYLEVRQPDECF